MADTPETQTQNQDQAQVQPAPVSGTDPVAQPAAQPVAAPTDAPVAQPVVQPVVATPESQPAPVIQPTATNQTQSAQTNVDTLNERKTWPIWLMASFAFILILCGIITICAPGVYWTFMDIILGIVLVLAGTSWIINAFTNEREHGGCLLSIIGVLAIILGFIVMFSGAEFVGTLSIWAIAIWALLRGCILIYYSLSNKEQQKFWRGILTLGILLIILFFVIAFSDKDEARAIVGICIGLSAVLDGLCLLVLSFRVNNDPSLQDKILEQANQNEIAQGNIGTNSTTNSVSQPVVTDGGQPTPVAQPITSEVQPGDIQQPIVAQPSPNTETPLASQPVEENKTAEETRAPAEENKPTQKAQQPAENNKPAEETQAPTA